MNNQSHTILRVREDGLCISCGACIANCPKGAISFENVNGSYVPVVAPSCVECGKCLRVCPSHNMEKDIPDEIASHCLGDYTQILYARLKDEAQLKNSTSGGVCTTLVKHLLKNGVYDAAFLVDGYEYRSLIVTRKFTKEDDLTATAGSRYLTVSHQDAMAYMLSHRDERLIFVVTSCVARALLLTIRENKLRRENYLLIGLFCDKTMHYGAVSYFEEHPEGKGRELVDLRFRAKIGGKWPGKVKLTYADGEEVVLPSSARKGLKEYFVPERCLYCLDKLNRYSDIAVGDNYIPANRDERGCSSVIVRTHKGQDAWDACHELFDVHPDGEGALVSSQLIFEKENAIAWGCIKGIYHGREVSSRHRKRYRAIMKMRKLGSTPHPYRVVTRDIERRQCVAKWKRRFLKLLGKK